MRDMKSFKEQYENISIEIITLSCEDIITTSKPFDGEDDEIIDW